MNQIKKIKNIYTNLFELYKILITKIKNNKITYETLGEWVRSACSQTWSQNRCLKRKKIH